MIQQVTGQQSTLIQGKIVNRLITNNKKKKLKRLSAGNSSFSSLSQSYYPSAFISNPCDQLFGPQPLSYTIDQLEAASNHNDKSFTADSYDGFSVDECASQASLKSVTSVCTSDSGCYDQQTNTYECSTASGGERFDYIPAPKWNKSQNSILEELFKSSRYPKKSELKSFAQRLHVMDSDIEEWFRKRRGRDRKTRRKNDTLKNLIDNYLDK